MKKVINGSVFDTAKAKFLGSWSNGHNNNDFSYCGERLFITKSGKYFLHGEGGAYSTYAVHSGNNTCGGELILPLTPQEAREWVERHLDGEEYETIFGTVEEGPDKIPLNITVSPELKNKLERMRTETNKSISQLIAEKFQ